MLAVVALATLDELKIFLLEFSPLYAKFLMLLELLNVSSYGMNRGRRVTNLFWARYAELTRKWALQRCCSI